MRWLLAGYCGLALINISVALNSFIGVTQRPRFYGVETKRTVSFHCWPSKEHHLADVEWYKADEYNTTKARIEAQENRTFFHVRSFMNVIKNVSLIIRDLQLEDKGVYFCKINNVWGAGTELQVFRPSNRDKAAYRTKMKDCLILLQALLLAVFIGAVLLRNQTLLEKSDSIYEEPETDHIYEGLTIETCGGGLYEELSVYAQADGAEAPWE